MQMESGRFRKDRSMRSPRCYPLFVVEEWELQLEIGLFFCVCTNMKPKKKRKAAGLSFFHENGKKRET
jgi:hypothetical protein